MNKYPELEKIAEGIAKETIALINYRVQVVASAMPYKAQLVTEMVIAKLETSV